MVLCTKEAPPLFLVRCTAGCYWDCAPARVTNVTMAQGFALRAFSILSSPTEARASGARQAYLFLLAAGMQPRKVLQPYCNRADTHCYAMDKEIPPDRRKPPKQAGFPDALGRASMYASKLVMSRSAVRVRSSALKKCPFAGKT
jgi:hypothetical protein